MDRRQKICGAEKSADDAMGLWRRIVMAIEIAKDFRRLTRAGVWSLAGILTFCAAAVGQAPVVSVGSVVPIPINSSMNQIYRILFYKGNVLALDSGSDERQDIPLVKENSVNLVHVAVD